MDPQDSRSLYKPLLICALLAFACQESPTRHLSSNGPELGIALGLFASAPTWDYLGLLTEIAAHGATDVMIVIPLFQPSIRSDSIRLQLSEYAIRRALKQAHELDLQITVMPMIQLQHREDPTEWRGRFTPSVPEVWWSNYRSILKRIAIWSEREGVHRLMIGSELSALEAQVSHWRSLIDRLRTLFSGRLTYSANWDHYREVPFWPALDEIAVTAYFPVSTQPNLRWRTRLETLKQFALNHDKPIIISEYGYPAIQSAARKPWDEFASSQADEALQAHLTTIALNALVEANISSSFLWNWFGFGGTSPQEYSPRGRESARVIQAHFNHIRRGLSLKDQIVD